MPVFNCVAVRRAQRAAVEEQIAAVNLDDNKVILGERAALDVQTGELVNAVIADADKPLLFLTLPLSNMTQALP